MHGIRGLPDAPELVERYGLGAVKDLWEALSRETVLWLADLDFGFHELDCLLIHGSTVSYGDELTPETPPIALCVGLSRPVFDHRLIRADANTLFCGRSGLAFECWVEPGALRSTVTTLDQTAAPQEQGKSPRRVVGVGNVGRAGGAPSYVTYNPGTNQVQFRCVQSSPARGFGAARSKK